MITIHGDARDIDPSRFERYRVMVADPPWWYAEQAKVRKDGQSSAGVGACHHYESLTTDEICAMPVADLAADRCHLYLWATCPLLPDALRVMEAWGFTWATVAHAWIKMNKGAWDKAQLKINQLSFLYTSDEQTSKFMNNLAWFGPGFYTGSNMELVLLGRRGRPFKHAEGCKASQLIFEPRGSHSQKPEALQDRIEWMYPEATPRLELFGRRPRLNWTVWGNEV